MTSHANRRTLARCTAAAFAALLVPLASAQVSITANGPYYASPSWSQKLGSHRFIVLANWNSEAVLDRETGLVWQRSPSAMLTNWSSAMLLCSTLTVGDRRGWRLPSVEELSSLLDASVPAPGLLLPPGHPFDNLQNPGYYWTATSFAPNAASALVVEFPPGHLAGANRSSSLFHSWCVRGGGGGDHR